MNDSKPIEKLFPEGSISVDIVTSKTVVVCNKCNCTGYVSRTELTDYHKSEYGTFTDKCKKCDGNGRLTETTMRLRHNNEYGYPVLFDGREVKTFVPYSHDPITKDYGEATNYFKLKVEENK